MANSEEETPEEGLDYYGSEKHPRRGFDSYSSSDSDSAGSCSSDQLARGATREKVLRKSVVRPASGRTGSQGGGRKARSNQCVAYRNDKQCVPRLCIPDGSSATNGEHVVCLEAAHHVGTMGNVEDVLLRKSDNSKSHCDSLESSASEEGEVDANDTRGLVMSLTSNYHVSTGVPSSSKPQDVGEGRFLCPPPPLDSVRTCNGLAGKGTTNGLRWKSKVDVKYTAWMDEIVERSVNDFNSKCLELSSAV